MHSQAKVCRAVVIPCICAVANHQTCFRGVERTETVATRILHAATLKRMMFGRVRLTYEKNVVVTVCFSMVSAVDGSERLITLKFKCDVGKFIAECDRLIQFKL